MTSKFSENEITPWYRQFWPWFLITLPAAVVVAGIITVFIAFDGADNLVADDYYKQGMGINRLLDQDHAATALSLSADLTLDAVVGEIGLNLRGDLSPPPEQLSMLWAHPVDESLDFSIVLRKTISSDTASYHYRGDLNNRIEGRWYVQISSSQPTLWRLKQAVKIDVVTASQDKSQLIVLSASEGR